VSTSSRLFARLNDQTDNLLDDVLDAFLVAGRNPKVSRWSVYEHLDHLARADAAMLDRIDTCLSDQGVTTGTTTWLGRLVLASGSVPRGKAEAVNSTLPAPLPAEGHLEPGALAAHFHIIDHRLHALETHGKAVLANRKHAESPLYGWLRPAQWLRIMEIHRRHHLGIIEDIMSS